MKRNLFCSIATLGVWATVAFLMIMGVILVTSPMDLVAVALLLGHASLSTAAIWWIPKRFIPQETSPPPHPEWENQRELHVLPLGVHPNKPWVTGLVIALLAVGVQIPLHWAFTLFGLATLEWIPLLLPFFATVTVSGTYLVVYCFWHLRTRYAGRHALSWTILLVLTTGLVLNTFSASLIIPILYCLLHVLPDAKRKGLYATPPVFKVRARATPLPSSYSTAKSVCFVLGWFFILAGILSTLSIHIANTLIWDAFRSALPGYVGETFTQDLVAPLEVAVTIAKIMSWGGLLSTLSCGLGAILLLISQKLRWRMMEEEELDQLRKQLPDRTT